MQTGFHFDQTRCVGCYACVIACKPLGGAEAQQGSFGRDPGLSGKKGAEVLRESDG